MRDYGNSKIIRGRINRAINRATETRDAIVYSVDYQNRTCAVKIQGSSEPITAAFPQNLEETPVWLKVGNAVRITHTGGNRNRIELVGNGQYIPSSQSGDSGPLPATMGDGVLSGGAIYPQLPPDMTVHIDAGTFRLGERVYSFDEADVTIPTPPGYDGGHTCWEYDIIVAHTDGTVTVVEGDRGGPGVSNAPEIPVFPTVPDNCVQLGWVLSYGAMATVSRANINAYFDINERIIPSTLKIDEINPVSYSSGGVTFNVTVLDQYGNPLPGTYDFSADIFAGNGTLDVTPTSNGASIEYTRADPYSSDQSPLINISESSTGLVGITFIELLDANGISQSTGIPEGILRQMTVCWFPEYPGAVMTPSGSNNDPGGKGMTSDLWNSGDYYRTYYEWLSDITSGLQSYDIFAQLQIPINFYGFQSGSIIDALSIDICTQENSATNNKIDVTIQKDGVSGTSSLTAQYSSSAGTWKALGFADSDSVLAALAAGDTLNIRIRLYSQNTKYARVGAIKANILTG